MRRKSGKLASAVGSRTHHEDAVSQMSGGGARTVDEVYRIALRMARETCRQQRSFGPEDICQMVMIKYTTQPPAHQNIEGWIRWTTRRTVIDEWRKNRRYKEEEPTDVENATNPSPMSVEKAKVHEIFCQEVLAILSPNERALIEAKLHGDTYQDLADTFGLSVDQAKDRVYKIVAKLANYSVRGKP